MTMNISEALLHDPEGGSLHYFRSACDEIQGILGVCGRQPEPATKPGVQCRREQQIQYGGRNIEFPSALKPCTQGAS